MEAFLNGRHFNLLTDPKSVIFMLDSQQAAKILKMIKSEGGESNLPVMVSILNTARVEIMLQQILYQELIVLP